MRFSLFFGAVWGEYMVVLGRIRGFAVSIDNESEKSTLALLFIFSVNCSLSVRRIKETTNIIITLRRGRSALPLS